MEAMALVMRTCSKSVVPSQIIQMRLQTVRQLLSPTLSPEREKEEADCIFSWQLASSKTGARGGNRTRTVCPAPLKNPLTSEKWAVKSLLTLKLYYVLLRSMASIYQRGDSKFWWALFKTPSGTWARKSTKTANQAEARRLAHTYEGAGATLSLETPEGAQFDKVVRQMWEQYSKRRLEANPTRAFVESWLARMRSTRTASTAERYKKPAADFIAFLGKRAGNDIRSITTTDLQRFLDAEAAAGKSPQTCAVNAKVLRAVFNAAMRAGAIEQGRNPAGMLEIAEVVSEDKEAFTKGEVEALLAASTGTDWHTAVMLGAFAGMRIGDATRLTWESVDFAQKVIRYIPQKTSRKKKVVTVPILPRLYKHLDALASTDAAQLSPHLCPALASRATGGRRGISAAFIDEVMGKAGIDTNRTEKRGKGHSVARKSFHSLKHYFISGMANAGVALDVRRKLGAHGSEKMTERYTHLELKTLRKAVGTLEKGAKLAGQH